MTADRGDYTDKGHPRHLRHPRFTVFLLCLLCLSAATPVSSFARRTPIVTGERPPVAPPSETLLYNYGVSVRLLGDKFIKVGPSQSIVRDEGMHGTCPSRIGSAARRSRCATST